MLSTLHDPAIRPPRLAQIMQMGGGGKLRPQIRTSLSAGPVQRCDAGQVARRGDRRVRAAPLEGYFRARRDVGGAAGLDGATDSAAGLGQLPAPMGQEQPPAYPVGTACSVVVVDRQG